MKTIITPIYNEEYLIPFFIKQHYWADKFVFLIDSDTNDNSINEIIKNISQDQAYEIIQFHFGFDDLKMIGLTNEIIKDYDSDYFVCLDCDEFIIKEPEFINNVEQVYFYQMYQAESEKAYLDNRPLEVQRKWGIIDKMYLKPCIVKKTANPIMTVGKHTVIINNKCFYPHESYGYYCGMHLNKLNYDFYKHRFILRNKKISQENKKNGFGKQYFDIDLVSLRKEFFNNKLIKLF